MSCENRKKTIGLTYHIVTNGKTKLHSASLPYFPLFFFVFTRPSKRIKPGDKKFKKLSTVLSRSFHGGPLVTVSHKTRAWIDLFFFGNCAGAVRGKRAFEVLPGTGYPCGYAQQPGSTASQPAGSQAREAPRLPERQTTAAAALKLLLSLLAGCCWLALTVWLGDAGDAKLCMKKKTLEVLLTTIRRVIVFLFLFCT